MTVKKMPRLHYEIRPDDKAGWGFFDQTGKLQATRIKKKELIDVAVEALSHAHLWCGVLSELRIKDRNHKVIDCRTYGDDPKRTKG